MVGTVLACAATACGASKPTRLSPANVFALTKVYTANTGSLERSALDAGNSLNRALTACSLRTLPSERKLAIVDGVWTLRVLAAPYGRYAAEISALSGRAVALKTLANATATIQSVLKTLAAMPLDLCPVMRQWQSKGYAFSFPLATKLDVSKYFTSAGRLVDTRALAAEQVVLRVSQQLPLRVRTPFRSLTDPLRFNP